MRPCQIDHTSGEGPKEFDRKVGDLLKSHSSGVRARCQRDPGGDILKSMTSGFVRLPIAVVRAVGLAGRPGASDGTVGKSGNGEREIHAVDPWVPGLQDPAKGGLRGTASSASSVRFRTLALALGVPRLRGRGH